jgi:hypothetical protein
MTEITRSENCGNSPKGLLLQDLTVAFARADALRIEDLVTSDVRWLPVGGQPVLGAAAFCNAITRYGPASAVAIEHVITHGNAGAVNGVVEYGRKRRAFCYIVEFSSAKGSKVREITSYSVNLE